MYLVKNNVKIDEWNGVLGLWNFKAQSQGCHKFIYNFVTTLAQITILSNLLL